MKINIHKGTNEIGGSCIELSTDNTTILLDYGTPLKKGSIPINIEKKVDAIIISHPHQDHFGELDKVNKEIPTYCGELSLELMNAAKPFTGEEILNNNFYIYKSFEEFRIGDFTITPYLVDHSAADAHALLVEADGQKILYSGDFRANGRKSKLFDKMINNEKLNNVDVLLMEGTMLERSNDDFPDEKSVENKIYETIKENDYVSFMIGSSQNIDTIISVYRACKRTNKIFVIDIYTAWVLEKFKIASKHIPNMEWENIQILTKHGKYYKRLKENPELFSGFKNEIFKHAVDLNAVAKNPSNYFFKISPWHIEKVINKTKVNMANIIYSQWKGYREKEFSTEDTVELYDRLESRHKWVYAHTSGHADLDALKRYATTINPKKLIPIHTEYKEKFASIFDNVVVLNDNEQVDISGLLKSL